MINNTKIFFLLMFLVVGIFCFKPVHAARPSDFGLKEGDMISASGSDDPDVYIINEQGYKRLFLNITIFNFYGHLGGFKNVKKVSPQVRDSFPTSTLFRNCETNDAKIYAVKVNGEDTGELQWLNVSGSQAVSDDPQFFNKVFCINNKEFGWYGKSVALTAIRDVPVYNRIITNPAFSPMPTPSVNATSNFIAYPGGTYIRLEWPLNTDSNIAGYNLYRQNMIDVQAMTNAGIPLPSNPVLYKKLNTQLLTQNTYTDNDMAVEIQYGIPDFKYILKSVNKAGIESSSPAEIRVWPTRPYIIDDLIQSTAPKFSVGVNQSFSVDVRAYSDDGFDSVFWQLEKISNGFPVAATIYGTLDGTDTNIGIGQKHCQGPQQKCEYSSTVTVKSPDTFYVFIYASRKPGLNDRKDFSFLTTKIYKIEVK